MKETGDQYKIIQLQYNTTEKTQENINLELLINEENPYDMSFNINFKHRVYLTELNKNIELHNKINIKSDINKIVTGSITTTYDYISSNEILENTILESSIEETDNESKEESKDESITKPCFSKEKQNVKRGRFRVVSFNNSKTIKKPKTLVETKLLNMLDRNQFKETGYQISPNSTFEPTTIEDKMYEHLQRILSKKEVDIVKNMVYVVTEMMKFINNYLIEGIEKKQIIIKTIQTMMIELDIPSSIIDYSVDSLLPEVIDILSSVDKREIIISERMSCFANFCV